MLGLVPTVGSARDPCMGAFGIVVITPVAASGSPVATILQSLFDLTPAEVKVARAITEGVGLAEIATRHAVTIATVRAQAKAVFAKTGTHRQAQLAAVLGGLARMPRG